MKTLRRYEATRRCETTCRRAAVTAACAAMRARPGWYDPEVLAALASSRKAPEARSVTLRELVPGMTFAADVRTEDGVLLVARGQDVTPSLLQRMRNFARSRPLREPFRVTVPVAQEEVVPANAPMLS